MNNNVVVFIKAYYNANISVYMKLSTVLLKRLKWWLNFEYP